MLRSNFSRNENEGDQRPAAKHTSQIEARALLQALPRRNAILNSIDEILLMLIPAVILIRVELRKIDGLVDTTGLLFRLTVSALPLEIRAGTMEGSVLSSSGKRLDNHTSAMTD